MATKNRWICSNLRKVIFPLSWDGVIRQNTNSVVGLGPWSISRFWLIDYDCDPTVCVWGGFGCPLAQRMRHEHGIFSFIIHPYMSGFTQSTPQTLCFSSLSPTSSINWYQTTRHRSYFYSFISVKTNKQKNVAAIMERQRMRICFVWSAWTQTVNSEAPCWRLSVACPWRRNTPAAICLLGWFLHTYFI